MRWVVAFFLSSLFIAPVLAASAGSQPSEVFALYSNLCLHRQSGDLLGTRVALLRLGDGAYAMYQESEGWPGKPLMVKLDPGLLKKSKLDFQVSMEGGESRIVRGDVTGNVLVLTSGGLRMNEKILRLPRVPLPETIHTCR
jgi:hypothetical protein